jgi:hypothetical protein
MNRCIPDQSARQSPRSYALSLLNHRICYQTDLFLVAGRPDVQIVRLIAYYWRILADVIFFFWLPSCF